MNPAIVISVRDNVATALEPLDGGRMLRIGDAAVSIVEPIPRGHNTVTTKRKISCASVSSIRIC